MKKIILLCCSVFYYLPFVYAQTSKLDTSFGNNGIVTAVNHLNPTDGKKVLVQSNGDIYVVYSNIIEKRHQDGYRDTSYGRKGLSTSVSMSATNAVFQPDGKIVLTGSALARFNTDGSLDSSFSNDGLQPIDFGSNNNVANSVVIQKDGKILVAGYAKPSNYVNDFAIARYNKDGSPDNSFSEDGKLTTRFKTNSSINALAIQDDGKILAVGYIEDGAPYNPQFALARYNEDGSLDKTFSGDGKQTTNFGPNQIASAIAVSVQEGGKIVVAGSASSSVAIAYYSNNGILDSSFSGDGELIEKPFSRDGTDASGYVTSIVFQPDGKIAASLNISYSDSSEDDRHEEFALVRYNTDGSPDKDFSGDGILTITRSAGNFYSANSLAIQTNGKILVSGINSDECFPGDDRCPKYFFLDRFNINGVSDSTFGNNGEVNGRETDNTGTVVENYTGIAFQKDGKIVAVGTTVVGFGERDYGPLNNFAVTRYNVNGTLDTTFSQDGVQTTGILANDVATSVAIQFDGKIVVAGTSRDGSYYDEKSYFSIARYNTDGSLDSTFNKTGTITTAFFDSYLDVTPSFANSLAIQTDGKIVVAGGVAPSEEGTSTFALVRYNNNGTLDSTFSDDGKLTTDIGDYASSFSLAIQADGKLVAGGSCLSNGKYGLAVARYNKNGTLDNSFGLSGKQATYFDKTYSIAGKSSSLAIQNDGKVLLAGYNNYPSGSKSMIVRYNTDGSLDNTFSVDGKQTSNFGYGSSIALQSNGKIVVGGQSERISNLDFALWRFDTNGGVDSTFGNNGKVIFNVSDESDAISEIETNKNDLYAAGTGQYPNNLGVIVKYLLNDKTQTPPTVSLTTSTNTTTYLAPASIKLNATASDADGTISKVEFYNGTTLLHTETVVPYGFKWRDVPVGNYTFTAKAYDNSGLVTTSAPLHISVVPNKAPTVSIINPANGQTFAGPATIHLEAAAKDPDGKIAKVEFYNGSTLLRTEYELPYTFAWKNVPPGNYTITAKAHDNWGAVTTSALVTISVHPNIAPTVSITDPAKGENFTNSDTILLAASAADSDGRIARVEFYSGSTLLRTEYEVPYRYHWTNVAAGTYTVTAVAIDNYAAKTTSAPVTITVTSQGALIVSSRSIKKDKTVLSDAIGLKLAPNPAKNIVNIYTSGLHQDKQASISVISASGVAIKRMQINTSTKTIQLDVSSLVSGVYTIKLISGDRVMYKQFVKL